MPLLFFIRSLQRFLRWANRRWAQVIAPFLVLAMLLVGTLASAEDVPSAGTNNSASTPDLPLKTRKGLVATPTQCDSVQYRLSDMALTSIKVGDGVRFTFQCRAPLNTSDPEMRHLDDAPADFYVVKNSKGEVIYRGPNN